MNLLTKILTPFLEVKKWLFGKPVEAAPTWQRDPFYDDSALADRLGLVRVDMSGARNVANDPAYMTSVYRSAQNASPAAKKTQRLAEIAKERSYLFAHKSEILKSKKPFYRRLRDLTNEEIQIETGRMVYDPASGAWVVKGEK